MLIFCHFLCPLKPHPSQRCRRNAIQRSVWKWLPGVLMKEWGNRVHFCGIFLPLLLPVRHARLYQILCVQPTFRRGSLRRLGGCIVPPRVLIHIWGQDSLKWPCPSFGQWVNTGPLSWLLQEESLMRKVVLWTFFNTFTGPLEARSVKFRTTLSIIIINSFCKVLFSGIDKLTTLYNILQHFLRDFFFFLRIIFLYSVILWCAQIHCA